MSEIDPNAALLWVKHDAKVKKDDERNRPSPRSGHTLSIVGTNAFLIGGLCESGLDETDDSTYDAKPSAEVFNLKLANARGMEWAKLKVSDPQPLPRWKHTATLFNTTQIFVFGGFHAPDHRLNDVWIFDTVSYAWRQPNPEHNQEASVPCQLANVEWVNVPPPRAGHTATLCGENIYVFGGYGGLGYSRRDLDDLYAYNVIDSVWNKVSAKGSPPERRSGHQACAVETKIYIFGGSNSTTQFQDLFVLDTEFDQPQWTKLHSTLPSPMWNQSACSVIAIPTWKIFTFGGVSGLLTEQDRQGCTVSSTYILDTGLDRWTFPKIEGQIPGARSDSCIAYDPKGSKLIVFGGWADQWLGDLYTLDVGNIVGPPYAITDMIPKMGPITGGTDITIMGIDFVNTTDVIVRFGSARSFVDVQGTYISQTRIECVSPDFTKFPAGAVDVRVALDGDSFTTTMQKYTYFSVTNANACIIFGPGLLNGCATLEDVSFVIQARDDKNNNRTTGGDEFVVSIHMIGGGDDGENLRITGVRVQDLNNGRYVVTYVAKFPGKYEIKVEFLGTFGGVAGPLRGSGTIAEFDANAPRDNNFMAGSIVVGAVKADVLYLQKFAEELSSSIFVRVKDDSWSGEQQIRVLMAVKEALLRVESHSAETTLLVDRSECVITFLREQGVVITGLEEALSAGKVAWEKILRDSPQIQNKISPMMRAHSGKVRADILAYEQHVSAFKGELDKADFFHYKTGPVRAKDLLDQAETMLQQQKIVAEKMLHVAKVFECAGDMRGANSILTDISDFIKEFKLMWDTVLKSVNVINDAKAITWAALDPEAFEDSAKALVNGVRRLPKALKPTDVYKGLDKIIKEFVVTCPIIVSLRSPAMRERHWRELMDVVKKQFELPSKNPDMLLKDLLEMELHSHATEVEEIAEKASKEAKHEDTLRSLEGTWSTVIFTMNFYKDTDVPLLKLADEVVEQLESDQMAVQSIVGSRYSHFKKEAGEWQRALGLVSDITTLLQELQRTWSYLEPLFIGSEEVKRELPDDAARFRNIDSQVRAILQKAWKIRNVKTTCTQPGLLDALHEIEVAQEQCKKSLSEFLDGKRRQFPRFYFMSEADLLDLLSNSSQPSKVLIQVCRI